MNILCCLPLALVPPIRQSFPRLLLRGTWQRYLGSLCLIVFISDVDVPAICVTCWFNLLAVHGTLIILRSNHISVLRPKGGTEGAAPPEGEGNPAEGGCLASLIYLFIILLVINYHLL